MKSVLNPRRVPDDTGDVYRERHYLRTTSILVSTLWLSIPRAAGQPSAERGDRIDLSVLAAPRIIQRFDFDETSQGNYTDVPKFWEHHPLTGSGPAPGFPDYVTGRFDREVGHDAPPSFRLDLNGGNVAYHYQYRTMPVRPNSDYQITAWLKTTPLKHARAWLSAYFLDGTGQIIEASRQRSPRFGGQDTHIDWQPVRLFLTGGQKRASHLGLSVWLVQRSHWETGPQPPRWIHYEEVFGTAWLDDIEVSPLPHRTLDADTPGNIFGPDQTVRLRVNVNDPAIEELVADLEVRNADGDIVHQRAIPIRGKNDPPTPPLEIPGLDPGWYLAHMRIHARKGVLSETTLAFAKLAPIRIARTSQANEYGIVLDDLRDKHLDDYAALIDNLGVGSVKFPIDLAPLTGDLTGLSNSRRDNFLRGRIAKKQRLIAYLSEPTRSALDTRAKPSRTLLDLLQADPASWRPGMSMIFAHFVNLAYFWQFGADGDLTMISDARYGESLNAFRKELHEMLPEAAIGAPWSAHFELPDTSYLGRASHLSIHVPGSTPSGTVDNHLESFQKLGGRQRWAVIESPDEHRYRRLPRLADLAKRLLFARRSEIHAIFVPQPWHIRYRLGDRVLEPTEDYLIFRTIADVIGDADPRGMIYLGPTVQCRIFDRSGEATLALWDDQAPPEGREVRMYLAPSPTQVDLWGNATSIPMKNRQHVLIVTKLPTFIIGLDSWLQRFRASFALEPSHLESSIAVHMPAVVFTNASDQPLSGTVRLRGPEGWEIRPNRLRFSLGPQETFRRFVTVTFGRKESAGEKELLGEFELDADRTYTIQAVAPFELGLRGIDVRTTQEIVRNRLIIRQAVTNRTDRPVSFKSFVAAPARGRETHYIHDLSPGQTVVKEYTLARARSLIGKQVRIGLRELHGRRVRNETLDIR